MSRLARSHRLSNLLLALSLISALINEALHGHACTGHGCMLCVTAGVAQAVLGLSLGMAVARPVAWLVARVQLPPTTLPINRRSHCLRLITTRPIRSRVTPVTLGVRLLI